MTIDLAWLPPAPTDWAQRLTEAGSVEEPALAFSAFAALANVRLNAIRTNQLDRALRARLPTAPFDLATRPVRLAVLGSATVQHLLPAIRVAGLRRGLWLELYEAPYGTYLQQILDPASDLHVFGPDEILFTFDAAHLFGDIDAADDAIGFDGKIEATLARLRATWERAQGAFHCPIIQQCILPTALPLMGSAEHMMAGSRAWATMRLNAGLRAAATEAGVDLLALDDQALRHGLAAWHDPIWWMRAKQDVAPAAAPFYGELVARIVAARRGLSRKCLVLDLDNTLWGGVVGDDGLSGLVLGQGSAEGEAFLAVQAYAKDLAKRGVVLAVVSKNDEANAAEVFDRHPEMLLRRNDIAAFVANWDDKAKNLRRVAEALALSLDALVFLDDNPFERAFVRTALPMVAVPELPDDPSRYPGRLAEAGYFEALRVTPEDRARSGHYQARATHHAALAEGGDLQAYLQGLAMRMLWKPFDALDLPRIVQLINKTNQFNLTTARITDEQARALCTDRNSLGLQFRLVDRLCDNGIIGVVIGQQSAAEMTIKTWLMSCRVIGRGVERAMLDVLVEEARRRGIARIVGEYRPSPKNGMVKDHYPSLGFREIEAGLTETRFALAVSDYVPVRTPIAVEAA